MNPSLLFLSRDRGSLQTTLPVIRQIRSAKPWNAVVLAFDDQHLLLEEWEVPFVSLDQSQMRSDPLACLQGHLDRVNPVAVVSGCSPVHAPGQVTPEQLLITAASGRGIVSIAILDFWGMYAERFCAANGQLAPELLPTRICALDHHCMRDLIHLGIESERICVTHNPWFDQIVARAKVSPELPPGSLSSPGLNILFVSQPIAQSATARRPYTQYSLCDLLARCCHARAMETPVTIHVWPHPGEDAGAWRALEVKDPATPVNVRILSDRRWQFLARMDLVVSSHSTVMYEALHYATPCLSLQPGLPAVAKSRIDGIGLASHITHAADLDAFMRAFDSKAERERLLRVRPRFQQLGEFFSPGDATRKVMQVIYALVDA